MFYLGFDIGGSFIKAVLAEDKKIIKSARNERPDNLEGLIEILSAMADDLKKEAPQIEGVGFGFAGIFDKKREIMLKSPHIPYLDGQPLKKILEEKFAPLPVRLEHDVHCFLLAEREIGLAREFENVFCLALGTGMGGAWFYKREIYIGAHGTAGEIGHEIVDIEKGLDMEQFGSNMFIQKELQMGSIEAEKLVREGDSRAGQILKKLGENVGVGVANVINILNPEAVIIGGGIAGMSDLIEPGIKESVQKFVLSPEAQKTPILFSKENKFGGALGAALLFD
jgi:glucokinase